MTTITLPPDLESRLADEASRCGTTPELLALDGLRRLFVPRPHEAAPAASLFDFLAGHTLMLADVHAVIAYYLRHRDEVRAYLKQRAAEAEALQAKIVAERPRVARKELLARRGVNEAADAPTGQ